MKRKLFMSFAALAAVVIALPMFAAFEAHVVNVTAKIENALNVPLHFLNYGTVFPQEYLIKDLNVELSQSFKDEPRVDDVQYFIRQKPKCAITSNNGTQFDATVGPDGSHIYTTTGHVNVVNGVATIDCGPAPRPLVTGETWGVLPSLCPYLSKHKENDNQQQELQLDAFHIPYTVSSSTVSWLDAKGYLTKLGNDLIDNWKIDLAVPCFGGYCAQDWETFVHSKNPNADPSQFTQPIANEHKIFGCDLWVEVSGVSTTDQHPQEATITVNKVLVNNNGGNNVASDFTLKVNTTTVASGVATVFASGTYTITEVGVPGYQATFSGDCDAITHQITLAPGEHKNCTITNDDIAPNITLNKVVVGGSKLPTDFPLLIDGNIVPISSSVAVTANSAHSINETQQTGYHFTSITGSTKCPLVLGGTATLDEGEAITCTITNTVDVP